MKTVPYTFDLADATAHPQHIRSSNARGNTFLQAKSLTQLQPSHHSSLNKFYLPLLKESSTDTTHHATSIEMGASDVLIVILAILLPPVAVVIRRGCGVDLVINILLCLLAHIPGIIHAVYIVLHDRERRRRAPAPYVQQTNEQALYGAQTQPVYFDRPRAMDTEPAPPTYTDQTQRRDEKQEYAPVATGALATKKI